MNTISLTVVILTFNEEIHIARCIDSVKKIAERIVIVDSGSTDCTCEIAKKMGAEVFTNPWINYATQFNWAIDHTGLRSKWVLRLDADEILISETREEIIKSLEQLPDRVVGLTLNLRRYFLGRWLRFGSLYPIRLLRIWRNGYGHSEDRYMDEHMTVDGEVRHINADFADYNLQDINWWTDKHNHYATREAVDFILSAERNKLQTGSGSNLGNQAVLKRWVKTKLYYRLPLGFRAFLYFIYRYILRLGFLDGWPGFVFHVLQGFWYRFLVDVKIYEMRNGIKESGLPFNEFIEKEYGYKVTLTEGKS